MQTGRLARFIGRCLRTAFTAAGQGEPPMPTKNTSAPDADNAATPTPVSGRALTGAWIETSSTTAMFRHDECRALTGAWIETTTA